MKKLILKFLLIGICVICTSFTEPVRESEYEKELSEIRLYLNEAKQNLEEAKKIEIDTIN